jgi:hypothetical protein
MKNKLSVVFGLLFFYGSYGAQLEIAADRGTVPVVGLVGDHLMEAIPLDPSYNHHQDDFRKKAILFLTQKSKQSDNPIEKANYLESAEDLPTYAGLCVSLSALWAYGKRVTDKNAGLPLLGSDDSYFFNKVYKLLATWNEVTPFTLEEEADIERFLSLLIFMYNGKVAPQGQEGVTCPDPLLILELAGGEVAQRNFNMYANLLTKKMFNRYVQALINPGHILLIGFNNSEFGGGHEIALYQGSNGIFYYYNPNSKEGELSSSSLSLLTNRMWEENQVYGVRILLESGAHPSTVQYISLEEVSFSNDTPYVGPQIGELAPAIDEFVDVLKLSPEPSSALYFKRYNSPLRDLFRMNNFSVEQALELMNSPLLSDEIKKQFINELFPQPFVTALKSENLEAVKTFIEKGRLINSRIRDMASPAMRALLLELVPIEE